MSKKMWNKIFKSSKTTKNAKLSTATVAKTNKRRSIYEEYQQLNGQAGQAESIKKPKKLQPSKQLKEAALEEQKILQQNEASATDDVATSNVAEPSASTTTKTTDKNSQTNGELMQALTSADATLPLPTPSSSGKAEAAALAGANDQLIGNKNNCNTSGTGAIIKQQSTFAKVVSSFTLKRSNNAGTQKQQEKQQQAKLNQKGNGNVNAAGKLPKSEFFQHATPTNQQQQQQQQQSSSHALQQRQQQQAQQAKGGDKEEEEVDASVKQQQKQQQQEKRSSQVLIVIKQIVTTVPKMVSATAATTTTIKTVQQVVGDSNSCIAAVVTDSAPALDGNVSGVNQMHSSATHDNVFILGASSATTTTTATSYSTPTTTTTFTTTTNTRIPANVAHVEKNNSSTIANTADPYPDAPTQLVPCPICRRTFNPVTLQKHVGICEKMATKKRNVFDSSRQRREGTELASYPLPKNFGLPTTKQEPRGQSPKPLQHIASPILTRKKSNGGEELARSTARASMRKLATATTAHNQSHSVTPSGAAASAVPAHNANSQMNVSTSSTTSLPGAGSFARDRMRSSERSLAKRIQPPPAEQCPHCERCFGPKAYDRHVEWCKEKALQASIKQTAKTEQNLAKERLEARTKYRAPCLKTKRSINRDKYAGLAGDENEIGDSVRVGYASHHNNSSSNNNTSSSLLNGISSIDNSNKFNSSGNNNGLMSLSMTSSLTSERKPTIMKDLYSTLRTRKAHRNAIELPPPSPMHHAAVGVDDYVKAAYFDNLRLMGSKLAKNDTFQKKTPKRRVTLNAINTSIQPQQDPHQAPLQFEKIRTRNYDERMAIAAPDLTIDQSLGDANALSAALTYTACPLKGVSKATIPPRASTQSTHSVPVVSKPRSKLKPKVPSEPNIRVDAGTVVTHTDEKAMQRDYTRNSQSHDVVQQHQHEQQLQPLTPPMQMLPKRQTTFDKLPNTTFAVTTIETAATSSSATASHTKSEVNAIRSLRICRTKRKKLVRQSISAHAAPMKAIPLIKESIEIFGTPSKIISNGVEQLKDNDNRILADDETEDEIKVIKAPPKLVRDKSFVLSGLPSDKYDPFISAKRQLEELCSSSPPSNPSFSSNVSQTSPQTPSALAGLPTKMSTSLTLSTSTPLSSPLTTNSQNQRIPTTPSVTTNKTSTNFRRTSSLRGPRRSPMLSSRPLFAQNHRPTIQRGLSDEGPISTNFLKPEEYDEMPVRSVCVNDYAVTKSPRVARRDNSLSNRKQSLKLNVQGNTTVGASNSTTNTPNCSTMLGVNSSDELMNSAAKYLSKTDSLAAFLKYERELEKLNAQATTDASVNASSNKPIELSASNSPATNLNNPVITKEFKDKSNTLSKQNSAKSIKAEYIESPNSSAGGVEQENVCQHLPTPVPKTPPTGEVSAYERETVSSQKTQALRLEPITLPHVTSTPATKQSAELKEATPTQLPIVSQPVNLNAHYNGSKPQPTTSLSAFNKDGKSSSSSEYIDPKLINKCDNLPVNLNPVRTLKSVGGNNAERRPDFSYSSSECSTTQTGPISQLTKLLPLTKPTEIQHLPSQTAPAVKAPSQAVDIPARPPMTEDAQVNAHPTLSQRSSTEGRNLLNRKKRLGRNHFLYDGSPEADDSCSADDEANRSSAEYYESKYRSSYQQQQQQQKQQQPQTYFANTHGQFAPLKTPPIVPPLPIFDDFDFEEFLSSFENDDEQFPLFKDCREFLLNRTSNKQRSTLTPNSMFTNNSNTQNHTTETKDYNNTNNSFQFPSLAPSKHPYPTLLLTPSIHRSRDDSRPKSKESSPTTDKYDDLKRTTTQGRTYDDDKRHADAEHKKREIFISIETEPNEHGRSPISPESLRNMVGNPQTMVEVEVDGCDNKFSKISDDDEQLPSAHHSSKGEIENTMMRCTPFASGNHLPNVQLNNAKNLIQRMQNDFRQMSEEVGANIRQAMTGLNSTAGNASMLYGGENVTVSVGVDGRGGAYVPRHRNTSPPPSATTMGVVAPMYAASEDVSGDACGDSDDMSSLDGYPISSKSSRRGVGSKLSADSAYGSLSRQRSSELSTTPHRSAGRSRPSTSSSVSTNTTPLPTLLADTTAQHQHQQQQQQQQYHYQQQQQQQLPQQNTQLYKYAPVKTRPRRISGSSSSDNSDSLDCNIKYKQQLQQQQQHYGGVGNKNITSNNNNNNYISTHYAPHHSNNNHSINNNYDSSLSSPTATTATGKATTVAPTTAATLTDELQAAVTATNKGQYSSSSSLSSTNAIMSASMKMSKFCHECGAKFLVEQAKFCMDCGVRRIVL